MDAKINFKKIINEKDKTFNGVADNYCHKSVVIWSGTKPAVQNGRN